MNNFLKHLAAMFVVAELVEAGAGGSEQNDVSGRGSLGWAADCGFQGFGTVDVSSFLYLGFDLCRRRANGVNPLHPMPKKIVQDRIVAAFVFPAENEVDVRRKGFERLNRCIDIG